MAYTAPRTWIDETSDAADFNVDIRDNQLALKAPPTARHEVNEGLDYSLSSTSWSDVDGVDLSLSITTTGGDVMIGFIGTANVTGATVYLDVSIDGTRIVNLASGGLASINTSSPTLINFYKLASGLSAGSHTFNLQYRMAGAGTLTIYAGAGTANYDIHPRFWVREMS